ncbi:MAG: hypothetical protein CL849_00435 [Crocinitomicaceae bacterium]|nr:hypothetical protein [Crocinitomicaceae bacterium]
MFAEVAILIGMQVEGFAVFGHLAFEVPLHFGEFGFGEMDEGTALVPIRDDSVGPSCAVSDGNILWNFCLQIASCQDGPVGCSDRGGGCIWWIGCFAAERENESETPHIH